MAYNRNIPAATDLISNSQSAIQANFQAIDSGTTGTGIGFARNHITMTDATNGGLHSRVDYYAPVGDPTVGAAPVASAYVKGTPAQLFFRNTSLIAQLTGLTVTTTGSGGNVNHGITTPWGIIINWGTVVPSSSGQTVTFAVPFNSLQSLVCTAQSTSTGNAANIITSGSLSNTSFKAYSSGAPQSNYFAIGV